MLFLLREACGQFAARTACSQEKSSWHGRFRTGFNPSSGPWPGEFYMLLTLGITSPHTNMAPVEANNLAIAPAAHGDRQRGAQQEQLEAGERQDQPIALQRPEGGYNEHRKRHHAEDQSSAAAGEIAVGADDDAGGRVASIHRFAILPGCLRRYRGGRACWVADIHHPAILPSAAPASTSMSARTALCTAARFWYSSRLT